MSFHEQPTPIVMIDKHGRKILITHCEVCKKPQYALNEANYKVWTCKNPKCIKEAKSWWIDNLS